MNLERLKLLVQTVLKNRSERKKNFLQYLTKFTIAVYLILVSSHLRYSYHIENVNFPNVQGVSMNARSNKKYLSPPPAPLQTPPLPPQSKAHHWLTQYKSSSLQAKYQLIRYLGRASWRRREHRRSLKIVCPKKTHEQ